MQVGTRQYSDVWGVAPDDLYAVRGDVTSSLVHFDGAQWSDVALPVPPLAPLMAIWGDDQGNLIAVGSMGDAFHRADGVWRREQMPYAEYRALHGSSIGDVFAVSYEGAIARFDGAHWAPLRPGSALLRGVWVAPACTYFAAEFDTPNIYRLSRRIPW